MIWEFKDGIQPRPLRSKLNPLWWLQNDEPSAQGNTFYYRYVRNPFQNFRWYVVGLVDREHWVGGRVPLVNQRSDLSPPESGWCWSLVESTLLMVLWKAPVFLAILWALWSLQWTPWWPATLAAKALVALLVLPAFLPSPWLPFVSYSSRHLTWQHGWQPSGGYSPKLNFSNSDL